MRRRIDSIDALYLVLIIGFAALVRSDISLSYPGYQLTADSPSYLTAANNIYTKLFFFHQVRPPLYPFFISVVYWVFGYKNLNAVVACQYLMGIVTVLIVFLTLKRLTGNRVLAFALALVFSLDRIPVFYERMIMTEALAYLLLSALIFQSVVCAGRGSMGGSAIASLGFLTIANALCKPILFYTAIPTFLLIGIKTHLAGGRSVAKTLRAGLWYAGIVFAVIFSLLLANALVSRAPEEKFRVPIGISFYRKCVSYKMQRYIPDSFAAIKRLANTPRSLATETIWNACRGWAEKEGKDPVYFWDMIGDVGCLVARGHPLEYALNSALLMFKLYPMEERHYLIEMAPPGEGSRIGAVTVFFDKKIFSPLYAYLFFIAAFVYLLTLISGRFLNNNLSGRATLIFGHYILYVSVIAVTGWCAYPRLLYIVNPLILFLGACCLENTIRLCALPSSGVSGLSRLSRTARRRPILLAAVGLLMTAAAAGVLAYLMIGHRLIEDIYRDAAPPILNSFIIVNPSRPLGFYTHKADTAAALIAVSVAILAGYTGFGLSKTNGPKDRIDNPQKREVRV